MRLTSRGWILVLVLMFVLAVVLLAIVQQNPCEGLEQGTTSYRICVELNYPGA